MGTHENSWLIFAVESNDKEGVMAAANVIGVDFNAKREDGYSAAAIAVLNNNPEILSIFGGF